ncbi:MAG: M28 family peptidase [Anaerolineae bacterium]|nr:M28 family peptidase [Anaerolineae bacterium]
MTFNLKRILIISLCIAGFGLAAIVIYGQGSRHSNQTFNAERAYNDLLFQINQGPRTPGSLSHQKTGDWIKAELEKNGWATSIQQTTQQGQSIKNIIGKRGSQRPWIILGAHYDSRQIADRDPEIDNQRLPVPGANDGASGVAVLLELARILPPALDQEIWIVFFDAEDQGNIPEWDWILGSRAFAQSLQAYPDDVVIVDMVGDEILNIYLEKNSNPDLSNEIWAVAVSLGYENYFIPEYKYRILDDHLPFIEKGISAVDIIDFDYPYWHTVSDTPDKTSPKSLKIVGDTLYFWLITPPDLAN